MGSTSGYGHYIPISSSLLRVSSRLMIVLVSGIWVARDDSVGFPLQFGGM